MKNNAVDQIITGKPQQVHQITIASVCNILIQIDSHNSN